jgi:hypothetical protein
MILVLRYLLLHFALKLPGNVQFFNDTFFHLGHQKQFFIHLFYFAPLKLQLIFELLRRAARFSFKTRLGFLFDIKSFQLVT